MIIVKVQVDFIRFNHLIFAAFAILVSVCSLKSTTCALCISQVSASRLAFSRHGWVSTEPAGIICNIVYIDHEVYNFQFSLELFQRRVGTISWSVIPFLHSTV